MRISMVITLLMAGLLVVFGLLQGGVIGPATEFLDTLFAVGAIIFSLLGIIAWLIQLVVQRDHEQVKADRRDLIGQCDKLFDFVRTVVTQGVVDGHLRELAKDVEQAARTKVERLSEYAHGIQALCSEGAPPLHAGTRLREFQGRQASQLLLDGQVVSARQEEFMKFCQLVGAVSRLINKEFTVPASETVLYPREHDQQADASESVPERDVQHENGC